MNFTPQALNFLAENALRNDRVWYQQNKDRYKQLVVAPFSELITALGPTLQQIDPNLQYDPRRMSRLYRDARRLRGRSFFRENVWFCFNHHDGLFGGAPCYYFEFCPNYFGYGCGYDAYSRKSLEELRQLILSGDESYLKAQAALDSLKGFNLDGDIYKRNHYPDRNPKECDWLNRKDIYITYQSTDFELLFDMNRLLEQVSRDFLALKPIYDMLYKAELLMLAKGE